MANIHHCLNPHCPDRAGGIRDRLLKTLREASLPDLNNKRNRFIPRTELIRLVDQQVVSQFLQLSDSSLKEGTAQETTVNRICTEEGQCGCGKHWCTGARILFVALALLGSERQILRLFDKYKRSDELCDSNPHPESFLADGLGNDVLTDWSKEKRELFVQVQWRMRSPYVGYTPEDKFCGSCSLPWIEREEDRKPKLGGFSRVRRIKIHPGHHNMVGFPRNVVSPAILTPLLSRHRKRTMVVSRSKLSTTQKKATDVTRPRSGHITKSLIPTITSHPY